MKALNNVLYWGGTVVPPYVGMARKQNGGCVLTPIFHLVVNSSLAESRMGQQETKWRASSHDAPQSLQEGSCGHSAELDRERKRAASPSSPSLHARDATTLVALQSRSISQTYILDSGPRRIAFLPAHLHRGSSCCSGSVSLQVRVGLV